MAYEHKKTMAMVHSIKSLAEVEIVEHTDNNNCKAIYNGKICTAIFNPFVESYYVDDKFGVIGKVEKRKS